MPTDKELKKMLKEKASKNPEEYFAVDVLKQEGYSRHTCKNCDTYFWSIEDTDVCGDPSCSGGFGFIGDSPAKNELDYIQTWKTFAKFFEQRGYEPIKRYPVAARWREDTDFVQASIYNFQPYVVSGEVAPPANPLVVPQFSLRFNDIDNVGITGAHYTGFVMIGQHAFMPPEKWDQRKYFEDIHHWLIKGLGLPRDEVKYHEDAWAGGGNFGPCMEYFSRGLELGNQVYTRYEVTGDSYKELKLKVLDMGMGHERNAWFTKGASTSYESTFPTVSKKLYDITGVKPDDAVIRKFLPYSSYLNVDEVDDINKTWQEVARKMNMPVEDLRQQVLPLSQVYSVGEHARTLLVALSDGLLPSNTGGGYNLRMLLRRALQFIQKNNWDVDLSDVCEWHADYLKPIFPELSLNLDDVRKIIGVEEKKFAETRRRGADLVKRVVQKEITNEMLVELYDSNGISPDVIKDEGAKQGVKVDVPDNFYALVAERHEQLEQATQTKKKEKIPIEVDATKSLYYQDWKAPEFTAVVLGIVDTWVALDQSYFFPTSGGQQHDTGTLNGQKVVDVIKQGAVVLHKLEDEPKFGVGDAVQGLVDAERRKQLTQNHTATHIVNGVVREYLGNHAWQAGAAKFPEKARLDITHYEPLSETQLREIERRSNEIVKKNVPITKSFIPRNEVEDEYGFTVYQGPVVPGKELRIVNIEGEDVEACGGTHLNRTGETGTITILKSSKVQDGIVRIEYTAGDAAEKVAAGQDDLVKELAELLNCEPAQIPARAEELFGKWKKAVKKKKQIDSYELESVSEFDGDVLARTAEILKTQPEHLVKTVKRFKEELENAK